MLRFRSYVWGGFESASHRRFDRRRVDSVAASGHDRWAPLDYGILRSCGILTARDAFRWHLIERGAGLYDWSSAQRQVQGALDAGIEVIWDLCHWGLPDDLDVMDRSWPGRLAGFSAAAARMLEREGAPAAGYVPINEIAFWAWAGGETGGFAPFLTEQGAGLKAQLVRGHMAATKALRDAGSLAPIILSEPLIWVAPQDCSQAASQGAQGYVAAALDSVAAILDQDPTAVDLLGLNHYPQNQWVPEGSKIPMGDPAYRPLQLLLRDVATRFPLPIALTETGAEEPDGEAWLAYVASELPAARRMGVAVEGICIYPIMDYPGWDNDRHCPCGLIGRDGQRRFVRSGQRATIDMLSALRPSKHRGDPAASRLRSSCAGEGVHAPARAGQPSGRPPVTALPTQTPPAQSR